MRNIKQGRWSIACVCMVLGFMLAVQFRTTEDLKHSLPYQRVEELSERLLQMEKERDALKEELDAVKAKAGENPNLYVIHDDDILRVINELRAAGAEAISINGQRLVGTSEIRCAGPTLSVNNVRSAAPFEIHAIGDKTTLENALKMRGGVVETLKVWGIQLEITASDAVYVPPYKGIRKYEYAEVAAEKEGMK